MTRQVDLLYYMKHNTSFQSQVMLAATQNSNFPRVPEQFIGWFMKFSVDFHKLKNRFKITNLTCSFTYLRWKTLFTRIKIQGGSKKPNSIVNLRRNLTFGLKVSRFAWFQGLFCICLDSVSVRVQPMCSYIQHKNSLAGNRWASRQDSAHSLTGAKAKMPKCHKSWVHTCLESVESANWISVWICSQILFLANT